MKKFFKNGIILSSLLTSSLAFADLTIPVYGVEAVDLGKPMGTVQISQTPYGLLLTPHLKGLTSGIHGFHIHENPSCEDHAMAAGAHWDPKHTNKHLGPYNNGHLGDLPALYVNADGEATLPILAPRLTHLNKIKNHALIIHEGGDNYSDEPLKLGGGGTKMICGVIK